MREVSFGPETLIVSISASGQNDTSRISTFSTSAPQTILHPLGVGMAYDPNHIAYDHTDTVSVVRFLIADTEADELSDAEITALATQYRDSFSQASKNIRTAIDCAEHLHTKYLKQATFSSAGTSVNLRERAEQWGNAVARLSQRRDALEGTTDTTFVYRPRSW